MKKKEEYRIIKEFNYNWGIAYVVQKHKYFLGIGYWKNQNGLGLSNIVTRYKYKEDAEHLIEELKNKSEDSKNSNIVGYY